MRKKETKEEQSERIAVYEQKLDQAQEALMDLEQAIERWERVQKDIGELETYYRSDQWKRDFLDDEAGKLPEDLKRGVLSEDGIYNMLERNAEIKEMLRTQKE